jgi:hypothetical protein
MQGFKYMKTTITIKYTLEEGQLETIAKGLGYSDTRTVVDESGKWEAVLNEETPTEYVVKSFTEMIEDRVRPFFLTDVEAHAQSQVQQLREAATAQVDEVIEASKQVTVETI